MIDQIKAELLYSILNTKPSSYPYLHYKYDPLLGHKSVAELESLWPSDGEFKSYDSVFSSSQSQVQYPDRRVIDMHHYDSYPLFKNVDFWALLYKKLSGPNFIQNILKKIELDGSNHPLKNTIPFTSDNLQTNMILTEDLSGFSLKPHVQSIKEIFVLLVYLPTESNSPLCGTSIYTPRPNYFTESQKRLAFVHERENFYECSRTVYKKNSGFSFAVCDYSWHGVEPVSETAPRKSIYYAIALKDSIMTPSLLQRS